MPLTSNDERADHQNPATAISIMDSSMWSKAMIQNKPGRLCSLPTTPIFAWYWPNEALFGIPNRVRNLQACAQYVAWRYRKASQEDSTNLRFPWADCFKSFVQSLASGKILGHTISVKQNVAGIFSRSLQLVNPTGSDFCLTMVNKCEQRGWNKNAKLWVFSLFEMDQTLVGGSLAIEYALQTRKEGGGLSNDIDQELLQ